MKSLSASGLMVVCAFVLSGGLVAGTVTINPGNGVATNVPQRITGDTDVVVNSGATGGGIVTLNPYNTYTGTTTLNSGTLIATALGGDVGSSIGLAGDLVLGAGTFRYAGADGATVSQAISSTVSSTTATVFDTPNDLTLSGGYTQTDGAFIKIGTGALTVAAGDNRFDASTLTSPGKTSIAEADTVAPLTLNTNGDAPLQGYAGFTVAEGTFRIVGGRNAFGANRFSQVGVQGTDAKEATLEIAGGENWLATHFVVCPPRNVPGSRAGVRITGGNTTVGNGNSVFLGCNNNTRTAVPEGEYEAFWEMTGGEFSAPSSSSSFFIGMAGKGKINVDISGGTLAFGKNMGFDFNDADGAATNDVTFTIRDGGTVIVSNAVYVGASPVTESVYRLNILDGGKLSTPQTYITYVNEDSSSPRPEMHVLIDGGTVESCAREAKTVLTGSFASDDVLIGTKGATFCATTSIVATITAKLVATNSVPGMAPKGVTIAKCSDFPGIIRLYTAGAWDGPTVVNEGAIFRLHSEGGLPVSSDVTVDGTLEVTRSGTVTAGRSLTVNGSVNLYTGATLALDGPISGDGKLLLYSDTGLSASSWTNGQVLPLVTAPISAKDSLVAFARNCAAGVRPANDKCHLQFNVTDDGSKATLSMTYVTSSSLVLDADKGYTVSGVTFLSVARLFIDAGYAGPTPVSIKTRRFTLNDGYVKLFNTNENSKMAQLAKSAETSGVEPLEAKMILNGGTLHIPTSLCMSIDNQTKTGYASVFVNGGNLIVEKTIYPNYIPTAAAVGNSITLNSGTISCDLLRCSASTATGEGVTYRPATITLNGGLFSAKQLVDLCNQSAAKSAGAGSLLYLNSGATLRAPGIQPTQSGTGAGKVWFNGGTMQVVLTSRISSYVQNCEAVYVGEGGAKFDMTLNKEWLNTSKYINLKQSFLHDPDFAGADGGVTIFGEGLVLCGSGFANSTFTGPIVVRDSGNFMAHRLALSGHDLVVKPTSIFRQYQKDAILTMGNLTLGEAGATESVTIKAYRNGAASLPMAQVTGALNVLSPVLVGVTGGTDGWQYAPTLDANGVYTTLVYRAENSNVDVSLFRGYPTDGKTATFEIVDSAYEGYKAVVMTVADGSDPESVATYSLVNGTWTLSPTVGGLSRLLSASSGASVTMGDSLDDGFDGILYVNAEQSAENRGTSGAVTFGAGALDGFCGILYPRSGTVTIPSLAWMTDYTQLRLGFGTVRYTGAGETIPGFQTYATGSYMANLEIENNLTVNGKASAGATGAFMKTGAGTLTFKGTGNYALGNNNNMAINKGTWANNLLAENGDSAIDATVNLSVGAGKLVVGEADDDADSPRVSTTSTIAVGLPSGEDPETEAELEVNRGTLSIDKNNMFIGYYSGVTRVTHPKFTVNGGAVTVPKCIYTAYEDLNKETRNTACSPTVVVNGGTVDVGDSVVMSESFATSSAATTADTVSTFTLNGGVVTVQTNFYVVHREGKSSRAPRGVVNVNGGELDVKGTLDLCRNSKTTGTVRLNDGGLLKVGDIVATRAGGLLHFNGGVFMPYGVLPNGTAKATLNGTAASDGGEIGFLVSEGGAVVDTSAVAGGTYTIAAALTHDASLAGADGGLVKTGAGTLVLSGTNTYTGVTKVEEGVLQVASDTAVPGVAHVNYGAAIDLGGVSRRVGGIAGSGVVSNGTLVIAGTMPIPDEVPFLDCDLKTVRGAAIDFGRTKDNPIENGKTFPVAQLSGSLVGDVKFRAVNAGYPCGLGVTIADGYVYVTTGTRGVVIKVR